MQIKFPSCPEPLFVAIGILLFWTGASLGEDLSAEYLQRIVDSDQCPTTLNEVELISTLQFCGEIRPTNEDISRWERCNKEVDDHNRLINKYNNLVRRCVANSRKAVVTDLEHRMARIVTQIDSYAQETDREYERLLSDESVARDHVQSKIDAYTAELEERARKEREEREREERERDERERRAAETADQTSPSSSASSSSSASCEDDPVVAAELYDRSCTRGEECYYSIINRLGANCTP